MRRSVGKRRGKEYSVDGIVEIHGVRKWDEARESMVRFLEEKWKISAHIFSISVSLCFYTASITLMFSSSLAPFFLGVWRDKQRGVGVEKYRWVSRLA